jgi:hypothetical protein
LRAGQLAALDLSGMLFRPPQLGADHRWAELARRRMRADYRRITDTANTDLGDEYAALLDAYDRGGLPYERVLVRLGYAAWLIARGETKTAAGILQAAANLSRQHGMVILEADAEYGLGKAGSGAGFRSPARP